MTAPRERHRAPDTHPPDILVVGDAGWVGPLAQRSDVLVRSVRPGRTVAREVKEMGHGVVVVLVPPADHATVVQVADLRRERPGLRAVLVDPAEASEGRLSALEAGFDDALPREMGPTEISARIAIQLMRTTASISSRLAVGSGVELDLDARALRRRGRFVHLRPLEFRILEVLARAPGRPLSRASLIDRAWRAAPPAGSRTIDVHIRWLREKVERDPDHPVHLLTVRGIGYQLEPRELDATEPPGPSGHRWLTDR